MCKMCHDKAPDTTSRELFLRWVSRQYDSNRLKENYDEMKKLLHDFGVDSDEDIEELMKLFGRIDFKDWMRKNIGMHLGPYGGTIKISTMVAALLEYRNHLKRRNADQSNQKQLHLPFNDQ